MEEIDWESKSLNNRLTLTIAWYSVFGAAFTAGVQRYPGPSEDRMKFVQDNRKDLAIEASKIADLAVLGIEDAEREDGETDEEDVE